MTSSGLGEAPLDDLVVAIEIEHPQIQLGPASQCIEHGVEMVDAGVLGSDVDPHRERLTLPAARRRDAFQQRKRQIVHRFVADVLKRLERGGLARTGEA